MPANLESISISVLLTALLFHFCLLEIISGLTHYAVLHHRSQTYSLYLGHFMMPTLKSKWITLKVGQRSIRGQIDPYGSV